MTKRPIPLGAALLLAAAAPPLLAQDSAATAPPAAGAYTGDQAARGEAVFGRVCAQCHVASQFSADAFRRSWRGRAAYELFELIRTTMPQDNPGRLRRQEYADVVAYVFRMNGMPSGGTELAADTAALRRTLFTPVTDARP